jgi:hypothetical protein
LDWNPKDRLRDIGEARFLFVEPQSGVINKPHTKWMWPAVARVLGVAVLGLGYIAYRQTREEAPRVERLSVFVPKNLRHMNPNDIPQISPDGRRFVMGVAITGQTTGSLWLRDLDSLEAMQARIGHNVMTNLRTLRHKVANSLFLRL